MHIFSLKLFCLTTLCVLTAIWAFSQNALHSAERAQKIADSASEINNETQTAQKTTNMLTTSTTTSTKITSLGEDLRFGGSKQIDGYIFRDSQTTYSPATEIRAIWITRGNYKTPDDIKKIVENCAKYNINMLVFQVRGNGTVFYKSKLEPWAYELTSSNISTLGQDPGWDPLQVAVDESHKHGLKLIAWLNTFPAWRGVEDPPKDVPQLWNTHRDWFMKDSAGNFMIPGPPNEGWYRFITPTLPQVQDYIRDIYTEIVKNYDVDGIHFDYVRYPGEIGDFGYDSVSLAMFKEKTGGTPTQFPEEWNQFRRDGVFATVSKTFNSVTAIKPDIIVTAAVIGNADRGRNAHFTSSKDWFSAGVMDLTMPMGYTGDTIRFREMNETQIKNANGRYVAPGIGVGGRWANNEELLGEEIQIARELGGQGVTFFAYNGLFPHNQPNELADYLLKGPFSKPAVIPDLPWRNK